MIAPGAPDHIIRLILYRCAQLGCDPYAKMIVPVSRKRKEKQENGQWVEVESWILQTSIDLLRSQAETSGEYEGQRGPYWCGPDGAWTDFWAHPTPPAAAKVGIMRRGFVEPLFAVAGFREFRQTYKDRNGNECLTKQWEQMPALMIAKVAEAQALRRAFPAKLSKLYVEEEIEPEPKAATALQAAPHTPVVTVVSPEIMELRALGARLGKLPRAVEYDLQNYGGETAAVRAMYEEQYAAEQEMVAARNMHQESAAAPQLAVPSEERSDGDRPDPAETANRDQPETRPEVRQTLFACNREDIAAFLRSTKSYGARIDAGDSDDVAFRAARLAAASHHAQRPVSSFNDLTDPELITLRTRLGIHARHATTQTP
jgi:phage recombination protein Bet